MQYFSSASICISIHASEKEATITLKNKLERFPYFNPRLREGGDGRITSSAGLRTISIHASEKEATPSVGAGKCGNQFQSTPPRRRRPVPESSEGTTNYLISIHASEKEATNQWHIAPCCIMISIHASEKEATATYCDTSTIMYISSLNNFFVRYF